MPDSPREITPFRAIELPKLLYQTMRGIFIAIAAFLVAVVSSTNTPQKAGTGQKASTPKKATEATQLYSIYPITLGDAAEAASIKKLLGKFVKNPKDIDQKTSVLGLHFIHAPLTASQAAELEPKVRALPRLT